MNTFKSEWLRSLMEQTRELSERNSELEEHIDNCERLLRCWCKPRGFSDTEDLREETRSFLHLDR
jgi:hypothetical protein